MSFHKSALQRNAAERIKTHEIHTICQLLTERMRFFYLFKIKTKQATPLKAQ